MAPLHCSGAIGVFDTCYMRYTFFSDSYFDANQAVPRGQIEAARSLGMSHTRTTITIVLPQAFRIVLPTKDSSPAYRVHP